MVKTTPLVETRRNTMEILPLNDDQARYAVETRQLFGALREAEDALARRYVGSMHWRTVKGRAYLVRKVRGHERGLGPRSAETEAVEAAFRQGKAAAEDARQARRAALERLARVNVALGLGRVPRIVARIVRRLDAAGLLGDRLAVVGTHALYAYEAAAGVLLQPGLLATGDVDLALDRRRRLSLATTLPPGGLLGVLQQHVDATFTLRRGGDFRATNSAGFMVELITSAPRDPLRSGRRGRLRAEGEDMAAAELAKLQWLIEAPRFEAVAIAADGLPVRMVAADPRFFAAHKAWLSGQEGREPEKRGRDRRQAEAVAALLAGPLSALPLDEGALTQLPAALRAELREAVAVAGASLARPDW